MTSRDRRVEVDSSSAVVYNFAITSTSIGSSTSELFREYKTSEKLANVDSGGAKFIVSSIGKSTYVDSGGDTAYSSVFASATVRVDTDELFREHTTS